VPQIASETEYGFDVQDAVAWRHIVLLRKDAVIPKASPAFMILQEEVSMSSSCCMQGLLIAENAG